MADLRLAQTRIVTHDVPRLAAFYAQLIGVPVALNEYYVEVPAGATSIGFSRHRFTAYRHCPPARAADPTCPAVRAPGPHVILDVLADDADAEYERIKALGVRWLLPPTTQPWGTRSMIFQDPEDNLINVFSRARGAG
jgi:catechol 2,3-dioxygenase-like lactoylglutathione lyase family enzyme